MNTPPLSDPRWKIWTGDLRRYLNEGGSDITAWCRERGLNKWTEVNLRAAVELVDGPTEGEAPNLDSPW